MNKNRKLVAFAERGDRPHVVVFDLELRRRRKVLRCAEFVSQEVISLAFSHDSKYLLAQGNLSRGTQCGGLPLRCHRATVYREFKI